jgi:acyl carrier protein
MQQEIYEQVAQFISETNDIPLEQIHIDATFEELGMDSLDGISLIDNLEAHYNISIPNQQVMKIRSVRLAVESLEKMLVTQ